MQGYNILFQTGYDHAGISTQNAVEKQLAREGTSRQGARSRGVRGACLASGCASTAARSWSSSARLGASMDYRRERFTMDDAYIRAVLRFFVHL